MKHEPEYRVYWHLNDKCNFRCGYCFYVPEKLAKENPACGKFPPARIKESFDSTGKTWHVHMSGGEPFLYPDFTAMCAELSKTHFISMNTNLSTSNIKDFADRIDPAKVLFINAGYHVEARLKLSADGARKFFETVLYLQEKKFNINVSYIAYPSVLGRMASDLGSLRANGVKKAGAVVFRGYDGGKRYPEAYSEEEKKLIAENACSDEEREVVKEDFNYMGRCCYAGVKYFKIDPAGNITRCSTSLKRYGNLFNGKYKFDAEPAPCPVKNCNCPYEGIEYASKRKGSFIALAGEIGKEVFYTVCGREITPQKLIRYAKERMGLKYRRDHAR
ncbi:MAG TPA: radical SAM protein [Candidatus Omnitrophota bacterium]|nr:radical SAM protein [Candidatus Omnitrophota bacterium]